MVQEGTPNHNVTLKGYPKNFWGLLDKVAHKTHQMTLFHPKKGGLSLTLMDQGQTYSYNPKCNPKQLPNETLGMVASTAHITQRKFLIGSFTKSDAFHWLRHFH